MDTLKLFRAILSCIIGVLFISCNVEESPLVEDEVIDVSLSLSGDYIEISDMPLTRGNTAQAYYAVKVMCLNPNTNDYERYATGIFDNTDDMIVKLSTSRQYKFAVALLYDYLENYSFGRGDEVTNEFDYSDPYPARVIHGGYGSPFNEKNGQECSSAMIDSYYGFLNDYTPKSDGTCTIDMRRVTVGLEIVVEGLTKGHVSVWFPVDIDITPENPCTDVLLTSNKMFDIYDEEIYDSANIQLSIAYVDESNNSTTLFSEYVEFQRGYKKRVLVKLSPETPAEVNNGISFSMEQKDIKDESGQLLIDAVI